jgi:hypothetical protein
MVSKYGLPGKKFKFETLFKLLQSQIIFLASTGIQEINISATCIGNLTDDLETSFPKKWFYHLVSLPATPEYRICHGTAV